MRRPIWASVPATWWQVEVLPTPPFWFSIVMTGTVRFPPWVWATSVIDRPLHRAPDFVVPRAPGDDARCTGGAEQGARHAGRPGRRDRRRAQPALRRRVERRRHRFSRRRG